MHSGYRDYHVYEYTLCLNIILFRGNGRTGACYKKIGMICPIHPVKGKMSPKLLIISSDKSARLFSFLFFKKSLVYLIPLCTMFGQFLSDTVDCEHSHDRQERRVCLQL